MALPQFKTLGIPRFLNSVSRVAVYVKAGSRYEPNAVPGISHYLRASAGITTERSSLFGITRHLERACAAFNVTSDREYTVYRIDCLRDKLDFCLGFVDDILHKPEFRTWELVDVVQPKLKAELKRYKANQHLIANEALHKAAYRGGLAHSIFIPEHQIEKIRKKDLFDFVQANFVPSRMSFVSMGVGQEDLNTIIDEKFKFNNANYKGVDGKTRYVGGEARIQAGFDKTLVNIVVEGVPISDIKNVAALEVLGNLIGGYDQQYVKYGIGSEKSLSHLVNTNFSHAIKTSIININYTDTGLFGFSMHGPNQVLHKAVLSAMKHVRKVLSEMNEAELKTYKNATKARALIASENTEASYLSSARRCAAGVTGSDPISAIDSLTLKDVQTAAANILKGKKTIISVGNPRFVPYLDELDA